MKKLLILFLFICPLWVLFAEKANNKTSVAIRLAKTGTLEQENFESINEILTNEIIELNVFEIVESTQLAGMMEEVTSTLTGMYTETLSVDQLKSAQLVMLGSIGQLYDQIVIVTRLVDAQSRSILFANTMYSSKDDLEENIQILVENIATNGSLLSQESSPEIIREEFESKNYSRALLLLNALMKQETLTGETLTEMLALKRKLEELRSKELFHLSKKSFRKKHYRDALKQVNEATLLYPMEDYFRFREEILASIQQVEDEENQQRKKEEERNERLQSRKDAGLVTGWDMIDYYYKNIEPSGLHLAVSTGVDFTETYSVGEIGTWMGGDIFQLKTYKVKNQIFSKQSSLGIHGRYVEVAPETYQMTAQIYCSPFLNRSIKITNLFINWGLDVGVLVDINPLLDTGYQFGVTGGGLIGGEFKFYKQMGIFLQARLDYQYYPNDPDISHFEPRITAGLIF